MPKKLRVVAVSHVLGRNPGESFALPSAEARRHASASTVTIVGTEPDSDADNPKDYLGFIGETSDARSEGVEKMARRLGWLTTSERKEKRAKAARSDADRIAGIRKNAQRAESIDRARHQETREERERKSASAKAASDAAEAKKMAADKKTAKKRIKAQKDSLKD